MTNIAHCPITGLGHKFSVNPSADTAYYITILLLQHRQLLAMEVLGYRLLILVEGNSKSLVLCFNLFPKEKFGLMCLIISDN